MPFWKYTALRFGLTLVFIILFLYLGIGIVFAIIFGTIVAWCICFLFFSKWRDAAGVYIRDVVKRKRGSKNAMELEDAAAEDDADPNIRPQSR